MRLRLVLAAVWLTALCVTAPAAAAPAPGEAPPTFPLPSRYPSLFPPAPGVGAPAHRIEVHLAGQQLIAFEGATPVRAFDISSGDLAHPTLTGHFTIQQKYGQIDLIGRDYYYHNVPYVMLLIRPFYIHAAPWRAEFGLPESRGCVTLSTADAAWLYAWAAVGTTVTIH